MQELLQCVQFLLVSCRKGCDSDRGLTPQQDVKSSRLVVFNRPIPLVSRSSQTSIKRRCSGVKTIHSGFTDLKVSLDLAQCLCSISGRFKNTSGDRKHSKNKVK